VRTSSSSARAEVRSKGWPDTRRSFRPSTRCAPEEKSLGFLVRAPVSLNVDLWRERSLRYLFPDISTQAHLEHTVRLVASGRVPR